MINIDQVSDNDAQLIRVYHPGATEVVDGTGGATQSAEYTSRTLVRLMADGKLYYLLGENPTATSSEVLLHDGTGELIWIDAGEKISVLDGVLHITVLSQGEKDK